MFQSGKPSLNKFKFKYEEDEKMDCFHTVHFTRPTNCEWFIAERVRMVESLIFSTLYSKKYFLASRRTIFPSSKNIYRKSFFFKFRIHIHEGLFLSSLSNKLDFVNSRSDKQFKNSEEFWYVLNKSLKNLENDFSTRMRFLRNASK